MTEKDTCSAGHTQCHSCYGIGLKLSGHPDKDHARCGALFGQECKEAPQPEKVEGLVFSHPEDAAKVECPYCRQPGWEKTGNECGCPCHHPTVLRQIFKYKVTIRAKDEEITGVFKTLWDLALEAGMDDDGAERTAHELAENISADLSSAWQSAEAAEAKVKELEAENGRLKEEEETTQRSIWNMVYLVKDQGKSALFGEAMARIKYAVDALTPKETPNAKR